MINNLFPSFGRTSRILSTVKVNDWTELWTHQKSSCKRWHFFPEKHYIHLHYWLTCTRKLYLYFCTFGYILKYRWLQKKIYTHSMHLRLSISKLPFLFFSIRSRQSFTLEFLENLNKRNVFSVQADWYLN